MMDIRKLTNKVSVSPQISKHDIAVLRQNGFGTIICNRPDGEEDGQPTAQEIAIEAQSLGIDFVNIPVTPGEVTAAQMLALLEATMHASQPVLAYCRTGTRSATLWALSSAKTLSPRDIIKTAGNVGYDLSNLEPRLRQLA